MNNTDYDCINDYSNFNAHLSPTNGLRPAPPIGDNNNNSYLFDVSFNNNSTQDLNNSPACGQFATKLREKPVEHRYHNYNPINCKYTQNNVVEGFVADYGLIESVPIMGDRVSEANRNMQMILDTDSALADFKQMEKIRQKEIEDKKYIEKQRIQNEKMESINKKMSEIELLRHTVMAQHAKLKGIQSKISGKKLAIDKIDPEGKFMIKANNKCLAFEKDESYAIIDCDPLDPKQKFSLNPISNPLNYHYILADSNSNISGAEYPFFVVQPSGNHKQCLHAGSGGDAVNISIQPCQTSDSQKWEKLNESMKCNL